MRWIMGLIFFLGITVGYAESSTEIIELHYRTADSLFPVIKPMLGEDEQVVGEGNTLILRASSAKVAEIRTVIEKLDKPTPTFIISVRKGDSQNSRASHLLGSTERRETEEGIQKIRVQGGHAAFISTGKSVPYTSIQQNAQGTTQINTQFREVDSGFSVVPNLISKNQIQLNIQQQNRALARNGSKTILSQELVSTLTVPLGEWVSLGGVSSHSEEEKTRLIARTQDKHQVDSEIWIKVDLAF